MPIGPIGQSPIDRTPNSSDAKSDPANASAKAFQVPAAPQKPAASQPEAANPSAIATQLVQSARSASAAGTTPSVSAPLGDLVNAVTSQMGMPDLPAEQRQKLVAQLADDPVVKGLIG